MAVPITLKCLLSFCLAFLYCKGEHVYHVVISKESPCTAKRCLTLEEYVKDAAKFFTSDTTLQFLPGNHTLSTVGFVEIWNVNNLTLVGVDSYTPGFKGLPEPVSRIVCNGSEFWNSGFAIINATNLHIESLSFSMCGTYTELLDNELLNVRNKSVFRMGVGLKAALFLVSIHLLEIVNITVEKSFGYGLLGLNVLGGSVHGANFAENNLYTYNDSDCLMLAGEHCDTSRCIGGNVLLVFEDQISNDCLDEAYNFEIWNSSFFHGVSVCGMHVGYLQAVGGLGMLFGQSSFGVEVDIHDVHIEGNTAPCGGNVYAQFVDFVNGSSVILHKIYSGYGNAEYPLPWSVGGGICIIYGIIHWRSFSPMCEHNKDETTQWNAVIISKSEIVHGRANVGAGLFLKMLGTDNPQHIFGIYIEKCLVSDNIGLNGVAVYITELQTAPFVNPTQILISSTKFFNNHFIVDDEKVVLETTLLGTVWVLSVPYLNFSNCIFQENELTGLAAWGSNIIFSGESNFASNRGFNGGGMGLSQTTLYLLPHTEINFTGNLALQRGGGIYVDSSPFELLSSCFFQIYDPSFSPQVAISVTFQNNSATESGTSLYGGVIDNCLMSTFSSFLESSSSEVADLIFHFNDSNEIDAVSSDPYLICICNTSGNYDCSINTFAIATYSGKPFQVSVVAAGQRNGRVPAVVSAVVGDKKAHLGRRQASQEIHASCTSIEYTVFSNSNTVYIHLHVADATLFYVHITTLNITLQPCPPGFSTSLSLGCDCDPLLIKHGIHKCDINNKSIQRKKHVWIGIYTLADSTGKLLVHPHCPLDYCTAEEMNITLDEPDMQCAFEHSGLLCGACKPRLSLALGSSQCLECSNSYLAFIALFAVFGILLVFIVMLLNLTTAIGTMNGLILYANILAMNCAVFFPSSSFHPLNIFIAWINLDFGIEVCFANGMDDYIRTWLQFVFPAYIWALVGLIIFASRYSVTLSNHLATNAVPVLTTLFLLSYTKIVRTVITTLSFTFLDLPDGTREAVWLHDGNVLYFRGKHIPLAVFGVLVLLFTVTPYTFLLLFGPLLQAVSNYRLFRWVNKLMPFFDAHYTPYKDRHRYWTGLLLFVRIVVLTVISVNSTADPGINLLVVGCSVAFILTLSMSVGGVYKNVYLTVLEASFLFNFMALVLFMFYFQQKINVLKRLVSTSVGIAFAIFIAITALHVVWRINLWAFIKPRFKKFKKNLTESTTELQSIDSYQTFPSTTYIDFREPLIEAKNNDTEP